MADISINPVTRRTQYTGNTGLGPFSFNFNILQNTDIVVYKNSTLLTLTTDYTVTINANGTGSVTLTGSGNGTALVLADLLTIVGGRELSRTTDFVTAGDLLASSLNEQLDSNVIMVQQLDERFDRAMKLNIADEDGDLTLPLKSSRAGKTLAFDSSGNPVVGEDIGNWRGDWVSGTTYTVRDLVKDGSNENVYRVNTAHTSSGSTPLSSNANSAYYDLVVDAESAATSASNAASSASAAASSASAASTSASNAATSATNASNSASAASTSASNAATSETNASNSATSAATQASNAATSATNAATSASNASTSETNAASSASSASTSATSAATSASSAATSATNAGTSAGNASTSETNAANSASAAATSASNAATSESNAATSATNSANSATASANSATSAAASAASAAASYDYFDDRYLGTKASDPTVDNDGDPLVAGALYFNSTANEMRVYDGANWIPASSAGSVSFLTYNYTATSGQTTFSGSDDNAASLSYSVGNLMVTVNGVVLEDGTDYTATSGTSVVLTTGAVLNDEVNIYAFKSFTTADMVPASTGGTFTGNVTFSNAATVNGAFTSVGIDDNATATAITIDSSENVGIKQSSPSSPNGSTDFLHIGNSASTYSSIVLQDNNNTWEIFQNNQLSFRDGTATRLLIDTVGNVGIGTSSPSTVLHIKDSTNTALTIEGDSSAGATFINLSADSNATKAQISSAKEGASGGRLILYTSNSSGTSTERMRITSDGFAKMSNNNGDYYSAGGPYHEMRSNSNGSNNVVMSHNGNTTPYGPYIVFTGATPDDNVRYFLACGDSTTTRVIIYSDGDFQNHDNSYGGISDEKLKQDITDAGSQWDDIKNLRVRNFKFKSDVEAYGDDAKTKIGLVAQEAELVSPHLVKDNPDLDEEHNDLGTVTKSIKYSVLYMKAIKALQEAMTRIEDLEARITALEGN